MGAHVAGSPQMRRRLVGEQQKTVAKSRKRYLLYAQNTEHYNIVLLLLLLLFCRTRIVTCGYRGPRGSVIIIKKLTLNKRRREILTALTVTKSKGFRAVTIRHI